MSENWEGRTVGSYTVLKKLGAGAMGEVYLGRDITLNRLAAIKVLPKKLATDPQFLARFQQEARLAGGLDHPNIVTIYTVGTEGDDHWFAMQYVEGTDLEAILRKTPLLEMKMVRHYFSQIADGLHAAHDYGIIHRDIKPSNIMVDARNRIKILDFGVARLDEEEGARLTSTGMPVGTLLYMSPEQCRGEKLDRRSDVFSLAVVLYRLLTGQLPFEGRSLPEIIMKVVGMDPPPPETINPEITDALSNVVATGLTKDRNLRFSTCAEMLEAFEEALAGDAPASSREPVAQATVALTSFSAKTSFETSPAGNESPEDEEAQVPDLLQDAIAAMTGVGGKVNIAEAHELFPQAASTGDRAAKMWIALLHHQGMCGFRQDPRLAEMLAGQVIDEVMEDAEKGDPEAQFVMGEAFYFGLIVEKDNREAVKWYYAAASQGHAPAMNNMGYMISGGEGVKRNHEDALRWYQMAAKRGHAGAMNSIGYIYANGDGVAVDLREAARWWRQSATAGNPEAQTELKRQGIAWS